MSEYIGMSPAESENKDKAREKTASKESNETPWHALVHWDNLPHWQQDNHYIHTSYRQASYSYARSAQSMLHWHNESVNIWTHFLPGILCIPFGIFLYNSLRLRYELASSADIYAMACFFIGAGSGMSMSGIYHTLSNHSPNIAKFWNQLDYVGIALMIWGSFVPSVYYGFWCDAAAKMTYWVMVSILLVIIFND